MYNNKYIESNNMLVSYNIKTNPRRRLPEEAEGLPRHASEGGAPVQPGYSTYIYIYIYMYTHISLSLSLSLSLYIYIHIYTHIYVICIMR